MAPYLFNEVIEIVVAELVYCIKAIYHSNLYNPGKRGGTSNFWMEKSENGDVYSAYKVHN